MKYLTTDSELASVANAIREKGGTSSPLEYPQGFVDAIRNIGPAVLQPKDVNFYDFDGTLLYSYTFTEANALTSLPESPTRARLTFQEWNWTLAQIKAYITAVPGATIDVGATYRTATEYTEVDITVTDILTLFFRISVANVSPRVSVDWGDGSAVETPSSTATLYMSHTYARSGDYTVSFMGGQFGFVTSNYVPFVTEVAQPNPSGIDEKCSDIVRRIRIGTNYKWASNGIRALDKLESISIPKGNASLANFAVAYCDSLKCVVMPSDVVTSGGFDRNYNLEVFCFSPSLTSIVSQMFLMDVKLRNLTIPSTVTTIASMSFFCLDSVEKLIFPSTITSIPSGIFESSNYAAMLSLKRMEFLCSDSAIGNAGACMCNKFIELEKCVLPSGITKLSTNHFANCVRLKEITIPDSVTTIGSLAFTYCTRLEELTVPSGVTSIEYSAFQSVGTKRLHMKPTTPPTCTSNIFLPGTLPEGFTIYVPYSADHSILNAYKAASIWSDYASYMQEEVA